MTAAPPPRRRAGRVGGILYALDLVLMFLRVAIVTTAWIALFLGTFFGYLTAPFIVLVVFVIVYAILDRYRAGARRRVQRGEAHASLQDPVYEGERR